MQFCDVNRKQMRIWPLLVRLHRCSRSLSPMADSRYVGLVFLCFGTEPKWLKWLNGDDDDGDDDGGDDDDVDDDGDDGVDDDDEGSGPQKRGEARGVYIRFR